MVYLESLKVHYNSIYWWLDKDLFCQWISCFYQAYLRPRQNYLPDIPEVCTDIFGYGNSHDIR